MMLSWRLRKRGATDGAGYVGGGPAAGVAVQGYAATLEVVGCPHGGAFDVGGATGRADQRFLVPIRGDQNQRFRRAVLFHSPASHDTALPAGSDGMKMAYPNLHTIYRDRDGYAKVRSVALKAG